MSDLISKVQATFDSIRPKMHEHGGDIELIRIEGTIVYFKFIGACVGCPLSLFTLRLGIMEALADQVPEITDAIPLDDETE